MKLWVVGVGRPDRRLAEPIAEYTRRAARYWTLEVVEVREEKGGGRTPDQIREAETERLLERIPAGASVVALSRSGTGWSSDDLASYLDKLAIAARPGAAFLLGGAWGLGAKALSVADHVLALSSLTLTHDIARLVVLEQLYRAGTIRRGEPYHKPTARPPST